MYHRGGGRGGAARRRRILARVLSRRRRGEVSAGGSAQTDAVSRGRRVRRARIPSRAVSHPGGPRRRGGVDVAVGVRERGAPTRTRRTRGRRRGRGGGLEGEVSREVSRVRARGFRAAPVESGRLAEEGRARGASGCAAAEASLEGFVRVGGVAGKAFAEGETASALTDEFREPREEGEDLARVQDVVDLERRHRAALEGDEHVAHVQKPDRADGDADAAFTEDANLGDADEDAARSGRREGGGREGGGRVGRRVKHSAPVRENLSRPGGRGGGGTHHERHQPRQKESRTQPQGPRERRAHQRGAARRAHHRERHRATRYARSEKTVVVNVSGVVARRIFFHDI